MPINQSQKIITELNCTNFPNLKRNRSHNGPKYLIYIGMHSCTLYKIIAISIAVGSINLKGYKVDANVFYDVAFCLFCKASQPKRPSVPSRLALLALCPNALQSRKNS